VLKTLHRCIFSALFSKTGVEHVFLTSFNMMALILGTNSLAIYYFKFIYYF